MLGQRHRRCRERQRAAGLLRQVVAHQLVERHARPCGAQLVRIQRRRVQEGQRFVEAGKLVVFDAAELRRVAVRQRRPYPAGEPRRREPLRQAVHRREFRRRRRWLLWMQAVLRVDHLEPLRPGAHLAEAAHPTAHANGFALRRAEVEQAHCEPSPAAIVQLHAKRPTPPVGDVRGHDFRGHQTFHARRQLPDGHRATAVFVAERQVQEQVQQRANAKPRQLLRRARADARQDRDRAARRQANRAAFRRLRRLPGLLRGTHKNPPRVPAGQGY